MIEALSVMGALRHFDQDCYDLDRAVIMTAFNNGEVDRNSFLHRSGSVTLTPAGRKAVLAAYERRLATEITHPIFGYKVSYRRVLEVQARLLARTMLHEIESYPNFCTR